MDHFRRDIQSLFQHLDMPVILMQRILKREGGAGKLLCPLFLPFVPDNQTLHILGLHDKDTETGNKDMIDLGGAAVSGRQGHIMQRTVNSAGKEEPGRDFDKGFPEHPFEPGGSQKFEKSKEEHDRNKAAKYFQGFRDEC